MLCDTCSSSGWVPVAHHDDGTVSRVAPCPVCRPAQRSMHDGGHYDADHDRDACETCQLFLESTRPKRRRRAPALTAPQLGDEWKWWDR